MPRYKLNETIPVADPRFPRGRREEPTYYSANFPENCLNMKKKENWVGEGTSPKFISVDALSISFLFKIKQNILNEWK